MNTLIQQFLADYINGNGPRNAMQAKLVKEMQDFADKQDAVFAGSKAMRVYGKAFFAKKIALGPAHQEQVRPPVPTPRRCSDGNGLRTSGCHEA